MFYEEVFRALNKARVKYAVAGGVAVVLHGYVRFTADLDLIIRLKKNNINKFFDVLHKLGYRIKLPVTKEQFMEKKNRLQWMKQKGIKVFSFYHSKTPLKNIDLFVDEPIKPKDIKRVKIKKLAIPVVSIEQLIRLKKKAGRPQDVIDITNLRKIKRINAK